MTTTLDSLPIQKLARTGKQALRANVPPVVPVQPTNAGVTISVETITPEFAAWLLTLNIRNRGMRDYDQKLWAAEMQAGKWVLNGESIKISRKPYDWEGTHYPDGILLDGQNRLNACVLAGVPFTTVVVRGLEKRDQITMDSGAKRTVGDNLKMSGEHTSAALAGALSMHYRWRTGGITRNTSEVLFNSEIALEWLAANPGIREALRGTTALARVPVRMPQSVAGAFFCEAFDRDRDVADVIVLNLGSGANMKVGDPILALRNWYTARAAMSDMRGRPNSVYCLAVCVKTWNALVRGEAVKALRWRGGPGGEAFPEMAQSL